MAKTKATAKYAKQKSKAAKHDGEKAYVIDTGLRGMFDKRKGVVLREGVGVLCHKGMQVERPDLYETNEAGLVRPATHAAWLDLGAFADYFLERGAKVTQVEEAEGEAIYEAIMLGKLKEVPAKYLKKVLTESEKLIHEFGEPPAPDEDATDSGKEIGEDDLADAGGGK